MEKAEGDERVLALLRENETLRRRTVELERESARRDEEVVFYRKMRDVALDATLLLDADGNLVEASSAFYASLGYSAEACPHLHVTGWDVGGGWAELATLVSSPTAPDRRYETKHRRKDGSVFDVDVTVAVVDIAGRRHLFMAARDITARKTEEKRIRRRVQRLEREVAAQVERAVASERAMLHQARLASMGEMLASIAHQWRQPLNVLSLLMADLRDPRRREGLDEPTFAAFVEKADLQVRHMSATISDFIQFYKPAREAVPFDVRRRVEEAVALVMPRLRHHGVEVVVEGATDVRTIGFANEYAQVVLNLIANAREAIVSRGVSEGRVCVTVSERGADCCVAVADNGGGIPHDVLPRLFEPYFTTREGGTGLGLYVSKTIISHMRGTLCAENAGEGAAFTITTPRSMA